MTKQDLKTFKTVSETKPEPGNVLDYFTYFHEVDSSALKKTFAEIKDSQEQFFDRLIDSEELEAQIKRAEKKYFKQKYCGSAIDKLKNKILRGIK